MKSLPPFDSLKNEACDVPVRVVTRQTSVTTFIRIWKCSDRCADSPSWLLSPSNKNRNGSSSMKQNYATQTQQNTTSSTETVECALLDNSFSINLFSDFVGHCVARNFDWSSYMFPLEGEHVSSVLCSLWFHNSLSLTSRLFGPGCVSPGGKCVSSPCPAGYECADFLQGFQCKCIDSSKCFLDKPGCEDTSCIKGMECWLG